MVGNEKEVEDEIIEFIKGWAYCRKLPETEIKTKGLVKKVEFGAPVYGRELEYFYYYQGNTLPNEINLIDKPHWLTIFSHTKKVMDDMKEWGYKLRANEYLMSLSPIKKVAPYNKYNVEKVTTPTQAEWINKYLGFEKFNPKRIDDPSMHYYFIKVDDKPVCTGIISIIGKSSCLDRIHTDENYRGRGLAASLCYHMLESYRKQGITKNILGSSQMGFHLYRKLGYEIVIPMYVFEK